MYARHTLGAAGLGYAHGDPIYNSAGVFVGNFVDGMTDADVAALLAYQGGGASFGGGGNTVPAPAPAPAPAPSSGGDFGGSATGGGSGWVPNYVVQTPAPAPAPVAAPAPAPVPQSTRATTNPALRDWIAANVNDVRKIYERLMLQEGLSVSQIDDVMAYPEGKSYGIAYITKYFTDRGVDPQRPAKIDALISPYESDPTANADKIYKLVTQNGISYAEMQALAGWNKTQADAILLRGAQMLGVAGGPVAYPGGSNNYNESTGQYDFEEGSFGGDYTKPALIGAAIIGAGILLMGGKRGRK